jgi:phosphate transport system substrate-binding protein
MFSARTILSVSTVLFAAACSGGGAPAGESGGAAPASGAAVIIRLTGSDTMVNLDQAWAEKYKAVKPDVSVQIAGGGSGVGIAGLIDGILDVAASSRKMEPEEMEKATKSAGAPPQEIVVGLDALAVYVHDSSPLKEIALEDLAEIYGDEGKFTKWSQLGAKNPACASDEIIRVSRQNNSGTYAYFREAVLGKTREFKLGSVDQSGSKDVVALVARTPCAIGYSGMAYGVAGTRQVAVSKKKGEPAVGPSVESALSGTYPISRPLYFYTHGTPTAPVKAFIDWTLSEPGQAILQDIGYVPAPKAAQ